MLRVGLLSIPLLPCFIRKKWVNPLSFLSCLVFCFLRYEKNKKNRNICFSLRQVYYYCTAHTNVAVFHSSRSSPFQLPLPFLTWKGRQAVVMSEYSSCALAFPWPFQLFSWVRRFPYVLMEKIKGRPVHLHQYSQQQILQHSYLHYGLTSMSSGFSSLSRPSRASPQKEFSHRHTCLLRHSQTSHSMYQRTSVVNLLAAMMSRQWRRKTD